MNKEWLPVRIISPLYLLYIGLTSEWLQLSLCFQHERSPQGYSVIRSDVQKRKSFSEITQMHHCNNR